MKDLLLAAATVTLVVLCILAAPDAKKMAFDAALAAFVAAHLSMVK